MADLAKTYNPGQGSARGRSNRRTKEGLVFPGNEIVIGYGKSSQLLSQPFRTYYAELDRLVSECEGVLFLGYGFADEHINSAFSGFWNKREPRPVVIIDKAGGDTMTVSRPSPDALPSAVRAIHIFVNDPLLMKWAEFGHWERVER